MTLNTNLGAGGLPAPPPAERPWCFSLDKEEFQGDYATRELALAAAQEECSSQSDRPPTDPIWIGRADPLLNKLPELADGIVDSLCDHVDSELADSIGHDEVAFTLDPAARQELGDCLIQFLATRGEFHAFVVEEIERVEGAAC
jgi:hypothetical protein